MMLLSAAALGLVTYWLIASVAINEDSRGEVPQPQIVLLTDHRLVNVSYRVTYTPSADTSIDAASEPAGGEALPVGDRELSLTFRVAAGIQRLRFALLLNPDAVINDALEPEGTDTIDTTAPGKELASQCPSIEEEFSTAEVLSGVAPVDTDGVAEVKILGSIPPSIRYREEDERVRVSVLAFLPPVGDAITGRPGEAHCSVRVPEWRGIGGRTWYTPAIGTGYVNLGVVPAGETVESANPPLSNPTRLMWSLSGPASVSYTLLDTSKQKADTLRLTFAGIAAALAAAIVIALITPYLQPAATPTEPATTNSLAKPRPSETVLDESSSPPAGRPRAFLAGAALGSTLAAVLSRLRRNSTR